MNDIIIRKETAEDHPGVAAVIREAFSDDPHSDQTEDQLVVRLRKSSAFIPELSLVAEFQGKIVGHILLSQVQIGSQEGAVPALALAPVSVHPNFQGQGIGSALITNAHQVATKLGHQIVVLIGHEHYYPRFGYELCSKYGIQFPFKAPPQNCMVLKLKKGALEGVSGTVIYPQAFYQ